MFTLPFKKITNKNVDMAGGKGASLGEMTQAKMKIPPGFVALAPTFDRFLEETDLIVEIEAKIKQVKPDDINTVDRASNENRDMILDSKMPKDIALEIIKEFDKLGAKEVAVRSSATAEDSSIASWAGELETHLNVTRKNLLDSVKKCWAALFTPRAIFYRFEKNLADAQVSVAGVIQTMVQSEISGICFTVHPVTCAKHTLVIEAGFGLGEAIVGGMVTPDTYVIHKNKGDAYILDKNISSQEMMIIKTAKGTKEAKVPAAKQEKQKLTDAQILKLTEVCLGIEKHYDKQR